MPSRKLSDHCPCCGEKSHLRLDTATSAADAWTTKDFVKLILIANLVAWPLGWLLMNNWLKILPIGLISVVGYF